MKISSYNTDYRIKLNKIQNNKTPNFSGLFPKGLLKDIFCKQKNSFAGGLSKIKNIHPGAYGTECKHSIPLSDFNDQFNSKDLEKLYKKGLSTNTNAWADCFLISSADKPLSTSSVYDCSVLYLFNEKNNTHFLYHSYFNADEKLFQFLIKTFMPEGFTRAGIVPGDKSWSVRHKQTIPTMFNVLRKNNKKASITVYHDSSSLPEIVGHNGSIFEIPNRRTALGLNDAGQASFKICDLKLNNILGEIDYNTNNSLRIAVLRNFFAEKKYDNEILKVLNNLLDKRQEIINKIEACKTQEELELLLKPLDYQEKLKYIKPVYIQKQKLLGEDIL